MIQCGSVEVQAQLLEKAENNIKKEINKQYCCCGTQIKDHGTIQNNQ